MPDSNEPAKSFLRRPRIAIIGGICPDSPCREFCEEIGKILGQHTSVVVVSGGTRTKTQTEGEAPTHGDPDQYTTVYHVLSKVLGAVNERGEDQEQRIETILPAENRPYDNSQRTYFRFGKILSLQDRTPQARRFALIAGADVVLSIGGEDGTLQMLELAFALGRPTLPIPLFKGASKRFWDELKTRIAGQFGWEAEPWSGDRDVRSIAEDCANKLIARMRDACMILMPFQDPSLTTFYLALRSALEAQGFWAARTDDSSQAATGDIMDAVYSGLRNCACAVALLEGFSINVIYEVGFTHALNKPVVLLKKDTIVPFDLLRQNIMTYNALDAAFADKIAKTLRRVLTDKSPRGSALIPAIQDRGTLPASEVAIHTDV